MFKEQLKKLEEQGLLRTLREVASAQGPRIILDGKEVINLCSNNYLGLADNPVLKEAAIKAIKDYGVGTSASRLISGTTSLHKKLEEKIAEFKGTEAALVFNSGYAANVGIISALVGRGDIIFSDKLNHASIVDGCLLSGAELKRYLHCDMNALKDLLNTDVGAGPRACPKGGHGGPPLHFRNSGRRLIVTDTIFSMDGDIAPLPEIVALAKRYDCMFMVDEAHATGVLGETGRGAVEYFNIKDKDIIHMGTLSKALGSFGAYVAGKKEFIDYIINKCRAFIYTTSLPVSSVAASVAALDIIEAQPELRKQLWDNVDFFKEGLKKIGADTMNSQTQIIPIFIGDNQKAVDLSRQLLNDDIFIQAIRPPTVPAGSARLRVTIMATHKRKDLEHALQKIEKHCFYTRLG